MLRTLPQRALSYINHSLRRHPSERAACPLSVTAIATQNLDVVFGLESEPFKVLDAVNLTVRRGHIHMVVGPSGAGKTTLLLAVAGLLTPARGEVSVLNQPLSALPRPRLDSFRRDHLGIMFQESNLLRSLTALENVEAALVVKGWRAASARDEARRVLAEVGLADREDHLPRQLSGGQQQRVAVARALAGGPAILIADEPTASLDSESGERVMAAIHQLVKQRGTTALVATHDARILSFADRVVELADGVLRL